MKYNEASVFVFIASIIVGVLIALNINLSSVSSNIQLTANEYSNAIESRNKLRKQINDLKDNNNVIIDKMNEYTSADKKVDKVLDDLNSQLKINKIIDGLEDTNGPGLRLTITDGDTSGIYDSVLRWMRILHEEDMINVINDLRAAGGETISINKQRVLPNSWVLCSGPFLDIDGINLPAPFVVEVIGDPKVMLELIMSDKGYVKGLKNRGINIEIEEVSEIEMKVQKRTLTPTYMTPYIK